MQLAADVLIQPSRFLAYAVFGMVLAVTAGLGAWLHAMWHHSVDDRAIWWVAGLVAAWSVSCVLVYRWRQAQRSWWLALSKDGMTVRLTAVRPDGCHDNDVVLRGRVAPHSLAWPGLLIVLLDLSGSKQTSDTKAPLRAKRLVVLRDAAHPADYRALSRWLHWLRRKGIVAVVDDGVMRNA